MSARDDFRRALGKRLHKMRKRAGMTIAELSEATGGEVGETAIGNYERSTHDAPVYAIYRLSAALGCPIEELTGRWE
jgi:transcriptional regulator with XRE-family HTH domain